MRCRCCPGDFFSLLLLLLLMRLQNLRPRPYGAKAMCHRKMCTHIQTCLGFTMLKSQKHPRIHLDALILLFCPGKSVAVLQYVKAISTWLKLVVPNLLIWTLWECPMSLKNINSFGLPGNKRYKFIISNVAWICKQTNALAQSKSFNTLVVVTFSCFWVVPS